MTQEDWEANRFWYYVLAIFAGLFITALIQFWVKFL